MDYVKLFKKGEWVRTAQRFVHDKTKLGALAVEGVKYVHDKQSLYEVKSDFILLCDYVKDVATGRYKGYKTWNLTVIVAAILYVISPIDIVPDFLVGGFLDDLSIVAWALKKMDAELTAYRDSRPRLPVQ